MEKPALVDDVERLVEDARRGSKAAFTELVLAYQARVRIYLDRFLTTDDDSLVDDLAQQTFLDAYRNLSSYSAQSPFDFWLLRLAKNRALTFLRGEERRRAREEAAIEPVLAGWLAQRIESQAGEPSTQELRLSALRACLDGLPPTSARLVADHYFRGRPSGQVARELGRKESAVRMALVRIRQALRECVELRLGSTGVNP